MTFWSEIAHMWSSFRRRKWWRKLLDILLLVFALLGFAIVAAWAVFQLGFTNNHGKIDPNNRYMQTVSDGNTKQDAPTLTTIGDPEWARLYARLAALWRFYPHNAHNISEAIGIHPSVNTLNSMITAAERYTQEDEAYMSLASTLEQAVNSTSQREAPNIYPWMNSEAWDALKQAIAADSLLINEAGRLTGVEPRLIVSCLIVEQIRLYNSNRQTIKKYLGPVKMLGVQSQFSYGVNGIKEQTAMAVEQHLTDTTSDFYMGRAYEHLLDFATDDHITERYNRLVDYRNHLYSYIYTGCILHQTMLQWRRAGFDISNRPEVLITLFNIGFGRSKPHSEPQAGGSNITIGDSTYTFGALGFDFYYSGEMATVYPITGRPFRSNNIELSDEVIADLQGNVSDCQRPERGMEYIKPQLATSQSSQHPDPYGIDPDNVVGISHTAF
ncbi:MAG: BatA domain-containing protein [Bacteroidales bacterium]|nr:BatA domain-containing protein [Bacteroidales bacterium]